MRRSLGVLAALSLAVGLAGQPTAALGAGQAVKVAIIVGPVGAELTPVYIQIAEAAADAAERHGATVMRAYSPYAHAQNVIAAVEDANIVVYLGHGVGTPNPYSTAPNPETTNGWGLNGPGRRGDHSDSWQDGTLKYFGEAWIVAHARPAPGFAMIYSNACYATGAAEPQMGPATAQEAETRVRAYSRAPLAELGASAYFATDFYEGAAHLIDRMLTDPTATYGEAFAGEPTFDLAGLTRLVDPDGGPNEVWLHRSSYFDGRVDYWYAFAGDPLASPASGMLAETAVAAVQSVAITAPTVALETPAAEAFDGRPAAATVVAPAPALSRHPKAQLPH